MNESTQQHIAVLGANGGIGRQSVELALKEGHLVTAILRNPDKLSLKHPNLTIVRGDVMDPEGLEHHLQNKSLIISAIGNNSFKDTVLYSRGNRNLIMDMTKAGAERAFFISASGLQVNPSHNILVKFATRFILQKLLRNMYADIERMEKMVKESTINWTILRPPRLVNKPLTGNYRFSINTFLKGGLSISRADLAHFMLHHINNEAIYKAIVEVGY